MSMELHLIEMEGIGNRLLLVVTAVAIKRQAFAASKLSSYFPFHSRMLGLSPSSLLRQVVNRPHL